MRTTNFNDLPDEILLKIFIYLKFDELCTLKRVCKRWNSVAQCSFLNKFVRLRHLALKRSQMENLISVLGEVLKYLHINSSCQYLGPFLTPKILNSLQDRCPDLEVLIFENCYLTTHFNLTDVSIQEFPPKLRVLSLRKSFFNADQLFAIFGIKSDFKIEVLDLGYCWCITNCDLVFFSRLECLKELYLQNCDKITDSGCLIISNRLSSLCVLDLEHTKINDLAINHILKKCQSLKKLFLGLNYLTNSAFTPFVHSTTLPDLQALCLVRTYINNDGLLTILNLFPRLQWLQLADTPVTKECVEETIKALNPSAQILLERNVVEYEEPNSEWPIPCNHFFTSL